MIYTLPVQGFILVSWVTLSLSLSLSWEILNTSLFIKRNGKLEEKKRLFRNVLNPSRALDDWEKESKIKRLSEHCTSYSYQTHCRQKNGITYMCISPFHKIYMLVTIVTVPIVFGFHSWTNEKNEILRALCEAENHFLNLKIS